MLAETIRTRPVEEDLSFGATVILTVVASISAAACYSVAAVFQQEAAVTAPPDRALRFGLLAYLVRRGRWLAGFAADVAGFGLQMFALAYGSLILVQALLVSGLFFALPLGAARSGRRLGRTEWTGVAALGLGLIALTAADPSSGRDPSGRGWVAVGVLTLVPAVLLNLRPGPVGGVARPLRLATATGLIYAATALLTKVTGELLRHGVGAAATSWQPYLLALLTVWGMVLNQSAFQAGPLAASLPMLTAAEPVVCAVIGVAVLHEHPMLPAVATVSALAAVVMGVVVLTRSPLVLSIHETERDTSHVPGRFVPSGEG
jgi:hypothetical protein